MLWQPRPRPCSPTQAMPQATPTVHTRPSRAAHSGHAHSPSPLRRAHPSDATSPAHTRPRPVGTSNQAPPASPAPPTRSGRVPSMSHPRSCGHPAPGIPLSPHLNPQILPRHLDHYPTARSRLRPRHPAGATRGSRHRVVPGGIPWTVTSFWWTPFSGHPKSGPPKVPALTVTVLRAQHPEEQREPQQPQADPACHDVPRRERERRGEAGGAAEPGEGPSQDSVHPITAPTVPQERERHTLELHPSSRPSVRGAL